MSDVCLEGRCRLCLNISEILNDGLCDRCRIRMLGEYDTGRPAPVKDLEKQFELIVGVGDETLP
jgi:hypothetical protein